MQFDEPDANPQLGGNAAGEPVSDLDNGDHVEEVNFEYDTEQVNDYALEEAVMATCELGQASENPNSGHLAETNMEASASSSEHVERVESVPTLKFSPDALTHNDAMYNAESNDYGGTHYEERNAQCENQRVKKSTVSASGSKRAETMARKCDLGDYKTIGLGDEQLFNDIEEFEYVDNDDAIKSIEGSDKDTATHGVCVHDGDDIDLNYHGAAARLEALKQTQSDMHCDNGDAYGDDDRDAAIKITVAAPIVGVEGERRSDGANGAHLQRARALPTTQSDGDGQQRSVQRMHIRRSFSTVRRRARHHRRIGDQ